MNRRQIKKQEKRKLKNFHANLVVKNPFGIINALIVTGFGHVKKNVYIPIEELSNRPNQFYFIQTTDSSDIFEDKLNKINTKEPFIVIEKSRRNGGRHNVFLCASAAA